MPDASYRFGPFVADRTGYRVLRDGDPLDLTPKLLDLLFHLLDHSAALVTKEALLASLWPDANVTDNALAQAMSELRQALGDDPGAPQFIKTVARRGYRFIASVTRVDAVEIARARSPATSARSAISASSIGGASWRPCGARAGRSRRLLPISARGWRSSAATSGTAISCASPPASSMS